MSSRMWSGMETCALAEMGFDHHNGFIIENTDTIKYISSAILCNEKIGFRSDVPIHGKPPREFTADDADTGIYVGIRTGSKPFRRTLTIRPRALVIGAGSRRGTPSEAFEKVTLDVLAEAELSPLSVCSLDRKSVV